MRTDPDKFMLTIFFVAMLLMLVGSCAEKKPNGKIEVSAPAVTVQAPTPIVLPAPVADFDPTTLIKKTLMDQRPEIKDYFIEWGSDSPTNVYFQGTFDLYGDKYEYIGTCKKMNTGWKVWNIAMKKE